MAKITDYSAATRFDSGDILLKDGTNGTKKIAVKDAATEFAGLVSAIEHRNTFRGKSLGSSVTAAQKAAIQNGTFDDLFIGDYWTIGGIDWLIADMDYWYNCGDTAFTKHHLVIVPRGNLYTHVMNDTNTTEGGYIGSKMYTEGLNQAKNTIASAFGDLVQSHREIFVNAVANGKASGYAWVNSTVDLMNENMLYGHREFTPTSDGTTVPSIYTIDKTQLAIFALNPTLMFVRSASTWLRDPVSASRFAPVGNGGYAAYRDASDASGVRPVFAIG